MALWDQYDLNKDDEIHCHHHHHVWVESADLGVTLAL